jgi:polyglutamine-binding protein 1
MPLPPALVAKLQKRGIIKQTKPSEEVYAEAYDEKRAIETEDDSRQRGGAPGCPNKWNQYHLCSDFCWDYWNEGNPESRYFIYILT